MTIYANVLFLHLAAMAFLFIGYGLEWTGTAFLRNAHHGAGCAQRTAAFTACRCRCLVRRCWC